MKRKLVLIRTMVRVLDAEGAGFPEDAQSNQSQKQPCGGWVRQAP